MIGIKRKKDEEAEKDIRTQNQAVLVGFRSAYVFDVSQTDGEELPELSTKVSGDVGERRERLIDFIVAQGIELEFKESIAPALGVSYGGKIVLLPGQSDRRRISQLWCMNFRTRCCTRPNVAPQPPRQYAKPKPRQLPL